MIREYIGQVILRRGLITKEQLNQALLRQKSHGGLLASHLLYYRILTEEQLVDTLSEHFGIPGIQLNGRQIPHDIIEKVPFNLATSKFILPFEYDRESRTLSIAVMNPDDTEILSAVQQASGIREIKMYVAVESILHKMIDIHYHRKVSYDESIEQIVEFPDLFEGDRAPPSHDVSIEKSESAINPIVKNVLMVTNALFLKTSLSPIFLREGYTLHVFCQPDDIANAIHDCSFDYIVISQDMRETFNQWIREGIIHVPNAEVTYFSSISDALLHNPVPYDMCIDSLIEALQKIRSYRVKHDADTLPYRSIFDDIRNLALSLGLRRIVRDGLYIIATLLIPHKTNDKDNFLFIDCEDSLTIAQSLHFPWDIKACLQSFFLLISQKGGIDKITADNQEITLGIQVLAITWYRHCVFLNPEKLQKSDLEAIKSELRILEGTLFSTEVIETYMRILDKSKTPEAIGIQKDIFIVSEINPVSTELTKYLSHAGFRVVTIYNFEELERLYERQRPNIIIINFDCYPNNTMKFGRFVTQDSATLIYAITTQKKSSLIISLLDSGFHDVFVPPFNFEIIIARMRKALMILSDLSADSEKICGCKGTFKELPFINLLQALSLSQRDIHILVEEESGQRGNIYIRKGILVHANCGEKKGDEAIYRIVCWRDKGYFKILPVKQYPADNIFLPLDAILIEAFRQLDEAELHSPA
ncbi:MAG: DUF4388 domain-containing protein [bacterium]